MTSRSKSKAACSVGTQRRRITDIERFKSDDYTMIEPVTMQTKDVIDRIFKEPGIARLEPWQVIARSTEKTEEFVKFTAEAFYKSYA